MLLIFTRLVLSALIIMLSAHLVPGIEIVNFWYAILAAGVISLINAFIKPIITLISMPINVVTLGLFSFFINAGMFMLASKLTPGFAIESFWSALSASLVIAILIIPVIIITIAYQVKNIDE